MLNMSFKIAFICTGNSARSQIAEGLAKHLAEIKNKNVTVFSAGSDPAGYVHPLALKVMSEKGIDISCQYSKSLEDIPITELDLVITLCDGAKGACPNVPGANRLHWAIPDPSGRGVDAFRWVRDELMSRIEKLMEEI